MATKNTQRKRVSKVSSKASTSKTKMKTKKTSAPMRREVKLVISLFVALVLILCFYSPLFGPAGTFIRNMGLGIFGNSAYLLPLILSAFLIHKSIVGNLGTKLKIYLSLFGIMVLLSMFFTVQNAYGTLHYLEAPTLFDSIVQLIEGGTSGADGGIVGALGILFKTIFSHWGSIIVIIFGIIALLCVATNYLPVILVIGGFKKLISSIRKGAEEHAEKVREEKEEAQKTDKPVRKRTPSESNPAQMELDTTITEDKNYRLPKRKEKDESSAKAETTETLSSPADDFDIKIYIPEEKEVDIPVIELGETAPVEEKTAPKAEIKEEAPTGDNEPLPDPTAPIAKKTPNTAIELTEDDFIEPTKPYEFPPISLLDASVERTVSGKGPDLREQAKILIETLRSFGVEAKILEVNKGPTVTRFEIQPSSGVKVSKITNLADDIALNLAALSVRIEAPIPGKAAVGIEIPNQGNAIVRLREVIDSNEFKNFNAKTAFALGKNITGTPIVTDISKMPHALIAGATGSGKSVCINALITSILYKADPRDVKFIMIDPKVVELSVYNGIPHLLIPVVTDPRKAAGALNWAVQEMTKRYKMFADNNVRDIKGYNELAELNNEKKLEQIIIIVDELADLMMVAPRDVEDAICRLAQMARAAGMHLVIATQRPSVDVITGVIKANVPSRIAFAVSSQIDSRTILDMGGAEKLLGKGDMLFLPMGASKPTRIQGAFISDKEVEKIVEFVKTPDVKYDEDVLEKIESGISGEKSSDGGDADELLPQAIEIVVEAGQASASLLQRRLKVGYSRAGRLIDQLEERGIIGPHEGAKPRAVLISRAEYAEMTMQSE